MARGMCLGPGIHILCLILFLETCVGPVTAEFSYVFLCHELCRHDSKESPTPKEASSTAAFRGILELGTAIEQQTCIAANGSTFC